MLGVSFACAFPLTRTAEANAEVRGIQRQRLDGFRHVDLDLDPALESILRQIGYESQRVMRGNRVLRQLAGRRVKRKARLGESRSRREKRKHEQAAAKSPLEHSFSPEVIVLHRRPDMKTALRCVAFAVLLGAIMSAQAACPGLLDQKMESLTGDDTSLCKYAGSVLLVVNTASRCGYTPQYEGWRSCIASTRRRGSSCSAFRRTISARRSPAQPPRSRNSASRTTG
jgi:hypothetical protein